MKLTATAGPVTVTTNPPTPILTKRPEHLASWLVVQAFGVLCLVGALTHEIASEEAQGWAIARASRMPIDIFANLRTEGHPPAWHLLIWPLARLGQPVLMQVASALLATATASIVARAAPFPLKIRILCITSYFLLYQYGIVARAYTLEVFFLVAAVDALTRERPKGRGWLLLAGAALSSPYGAILAAALLIGILIFWRDSARPSPRLCRPLIGVCCVAIVYGALQPLIARNPTVEQNLNRSPGGGAPRALLDIGLPNTEMTWPALFGHVHGTPLLYGALVAVALGAITFGAKTSRASLAIWAVGFAGSSAAMALSHFAAIQHRGSVWLAALLALWVGRAAPLRSTPSSAHPPRVARLAAFVTVAMLACNSILGVATTARDIVQPYAPFEAASAWLEERHLGDAEFFTNSMPRTIAVTVLVDRPAHFAPDWTSSRFIRWDEQAAALPVDALEAGRRWHAEHPDQRVVLLTDEPLLEVPANATFAAFTAGFREPAVDRVFVYVLG